MTYTYRVTANCVHILGLHIKEPKSCIVVDVDPHDAIECACRELAIIASDVTEVKCLSKTDENTIISSKACL